MNTDQVPLPEVINPLILRPLTPDEWERNQVLCEELLGYVLGQDSKPGE